MITADLAAFDDVFDGEESPDWKFTQLGGALRTAYTRTLTGIPKRGSVPTEEPSVETGEAMMCLGPDRKLYIWDGTDWTVFTGVAVV